METGQIPADRHYTKSHEWVTVDGKTVTVGITDHAQSELTDIVFVDLPAVGKAVTAGQGVLVLESVKTVADVYAPASGRVTEANAELKAHPELVNREPYGRGWLYRFEVEGSFDPAALLSADGYRQFVASGAH
jgi:glycine cleavage system H protein